MSVRGYEDHPFVSGHEQEGSETRQGSAAPSDLLHLLVDLFSPSQQLPPPASGCSPHFESG